MVSSACTRARSPSLLPQSKLKAQVNPEREKPSRSSESKKSSPSPKPTTHRINPSSQAKKLTIQIPLIHRPTLRLSPTLPLIQHPPQPSRILLVRHRDRILLVLVEIQPLQHRPSRARALDPRSGRFGRLAEDRGGRGCERRAEGLRDAGLGGCGGRAGGGARGRCGGGFGGCGC